MSAPQSPLHCSTEQANQSRWILVAFFLVFALPVLAAYLALYSGWWQKQGSTEHGQLLVPPVQLNTLKLRDASAQPLTAHFLQKRWWLIYHMPNECLATCENSLFLMNQLKTSLGPDNDRLNLAILFTQSNSTIAEKLQRLYPKFTQMHGDASTLAQALTPFFKLPKALPQAEDHLYIMDPLGEIMLRYPTYSNPKESILQGRGLLKDLQKLLKDSHIG